MGFSKDLSDHSPHSHGTPESVTPSAAKAISCDRHTDNGVIIHPNFRYFNTFFQKNKFLDIKFKKTSIFHAKTDNTPKRKAPGGSLRRALLRNKAIIPFQFFSFAKISGGTWGTSYIWSCPCASPKEHWNKRVRICACILRIHSSPPSAQCG